MNSTPHSSNDLVCFPTFPSHPPRSSYKPMVTPCSCSLAHPCPGASSCCPALLPGRQLQNCLPCAPEQHPGLIEPKRETNKQKIGGHTCGKCRENEARGLRVPTLPTWNPTPGGSHGSAFKGREGHSDAAGRLEAPQSPSNPPTSSQHCPLPSVFLPELLSSQPCRRGTLLHHSAFAVLLYACRCKALLPPTWVQGTRCSTQHRGTNPSFNLCCQRNEGKLAEICL